MDEPSTDAPFPTSSAGSGISTCHDAASPGPTTMMVAATPNKTPGCAVASKCQRSAETIICFRNGGEQGDLVDGLDAGAECWWRKDRDGSSVDSC
jgi:hypothetical protein